MGRGDARPDTQLDASADARHTSKNAIFGCQDPSSYLGTPHCHSHKSTLHAHIQRPLKLIHSNNVVPLADDLRLPGTCRHLTSTGSHPRARGVYHDSHLLRASSKTLTKCVAHQYYNSCCPNDSLRGLTARRALKFARVLVDTPHLVARMQTEYHTSCACCM
jgi:hypothetical protein